MSDFRYTDEQWAAISCELSRVGINGDTETLIAVSIGYSAGPPISVRSALEADARVYLLETQVFTPKHEAKRVKAQRAVKRSERLREAIQQLDLGDKIYSADLTLRLHRFEKGCQDYFIVKHGYEEAYKYSFIESVLSIYVEAIAKEFPDRKPRYNVGPPDGPTVSFLYVASSPVLGNETPAREAIRKWLRDDQRDFAIADYRAGKSYKMSDSKRLRGYFSKIPTLLKRPTILKIGH